MPLDARKTAEEILKRLDAEPDLQIALLDAANRLGVSCEAKTRSNKKIQLTFSPNDAEFLTSLIGDAVLRGDDRQLARKIYCALRKAGISDDF